MIDTMVSAGWSSPSCSYHYYLLLMLTVWEYFLNLGELMLVKRRNWPIFALKYFVMYSLAYLFGPKFMRKDPGNLLKTILEKSWNFVGFFV
jgi:hypothetical protein